MTLGEGFVENIDESSIKPTVTAGTSYSSFWETFSFFFIECLQTESSFIYDIDIGK